VVVAVVAAAIFLTTLAGLPREVTATADSLGGHAVQLILALAALAVFCVVVFGSKRIKNAIQDLRPSEQPAQVHHHGPYYAAPVTIQIGGGGLPNATPAEGRGQPATTRTIEGTPDNYKIVNVWELAEGVPGQPLSIINRTLRYVELRGPALIGIAGGVTFEDVGFGMLEQNPESIIWPLGSDPAAPKIGLFVLQNCLLEHCRTQDLGFTGPPEVLNQLRQLR
jgi:hypothetical protein